MRLAWLCCLFVGAMVMLVISVNGASLFSPQRSTSDVGMSSRSLSTSFTSKGGGGGAGGTFGGINSKTPPAVPGQRSNENRSASSGGQGRGQHSAPPPPPQQRDTKEQKKKVPRWTHLFGNSDKDPTETKARHTTTKDKKGLVHSVSRSSIIEIMGGPFVLHQSFETLEPATEEERSGDQGQGHKERGTDVKSRITRSISAVFNRSPSRQSVDGRRGPGLERSISGIREGDEQGDGVPPARQQQRQKKSTFSFLNERSRPSSARERKESAEVMKGDGDLWPEVTVEEVQRGAVLESLRLNHAASFALQANAQRLEQELKRAQDEHDVDDDDGRESEGDCKDEKRIKTGTFISPPKSPKQPPKHPLFRETLTEFADKAKDYGDDVELLQQDSPPTSSTNYAYRYKAREYLKRARQRMRWLFEKHPERYYAHDLLMQFPALRMYRIVAHPRKQTYDGILAGQDFVNSALSIEVKTGRIITRTEDSLLRIRTIRADMQAHDFSRAPGKYRTSDVRMDESSPTVVLTGVISFNDCSSASQYQTDQAAGSLGKAFWVARDVFVVDAGTLARDQDEEKDEAGEEALLALLKASPEQMERAVQAVEQMDRTFRETFQDALGVPRKPHQLLSRPGESQTFSMLVSRHPGIFYREIVLPSLNGHVQNVHTELLTRATRRQHFRKARPSAFGPNQFCGELEEASTATLIRPKILPAHAVLMRIKGEKESLHSIYQQFNWIPLEVYVTEGTHVTANGTPLIESIFTMKSWNGEVPGHPQDDDSLVESQSELEALVRPTPSRRFSPQKVVSREGQGVRMPPPDPPSLTQSTVASASSSSASQRRHTSSTSNPRTSASSVSFEENPRTSDSVRSESKGSASKSSHTSTTTPPSSSSSPTTSLLLVDKVLQEEDAEGEGSRRRSSMMLARSRPSSTRSSPDSTPTVDQGRRQLQPHSESLQMQRQDPPDDDHAKSVTFFGDDAKHRRGSEEWPDDKDGTIPSQSISSSAHHRQQQQQHSDSHPKTFKKEKPHHRRSYSNSNRYTDEQVLENLKENPLVLRDGFVINQGVSITAPFVFYAAMIRGSIQPALKERLKELSAESTRLEECHKKGQKFVPPESALDLFSRHQQVPPIGPPRDAKKQSDAHGADEDGKESEEAPLPPPQSEKKRSVEIPRAVSNLGPRHVGSTVRRPGERTLMPREALMALGSMGGCDQDQINQVFFEQFLESQNRAKAADLQGHPPKHHRKCQCLACSRR